MNQITYDYRGTKVLITGGTSGIGHATARQFAAAGADVTVTGTRSSASGYETDLSGIAYHPCQLTDSDSIDELVDSLTDLDVLVNNAGANLGGTDEWQPDVYAQSVALNLIGPMRLTMGCHDRLKASTMAGGSSVVCVLSMAAYRSAPMVPGYGSAKMGVVSLTLNLARRWAPDGIRVNAVAPGFIDTPMTKGVAEFPQILKAEVDHTAMGRSGTADETAASVLFLCSEAASYITGTSLAVDGGYLTI